MTMVLGFCVICTGIFILQMSKVDPRKLQNIDRKSTLLLEVVRQEVVPLGEDGDDDTLSEEKIVKATIEYVPSYVPVFLGVT